MPQMSPLPWLLLMMMFILALLMMVMQTSHMMEQKPMTQKQSKINFKKYWLW